MSFALEIWHLWPLLVAGFFSAGFRELMEESMRNRWPSSWTWWNSRTGWRNKHNWQPSWLFKTILVWTTDAEHFFQLLMTLANVAAVGLAVKYPANMALFAALAYWLGDGLFGFVKEIFLKRIQ